MKKIIFVLSLLLLTTCKKDDDGTVNNCNFLLNVGVNRTISLNLPQYSQLQFSTNSVYVPNEGNAGIYVTNVGGNFRAYDAADPNHAPATCSFMSLNGTTVTCGCSDENQYNLLTGLSDGGQLPCALQEYRVTANGSELIISN
ncbi:Rieske (2Fe-2S) protein [Psychroserpens mesophilus]|uniref:Rieske (2Fe-2S) protein n=1 Tax=Psychroserpens mesophilus TaxID=325473 RepID=UPI003D654118